MSGPAEPAEERVGDPLEHDRARDPAAAGAERHLDPDLPRPLLDHRVHDVGHARRRR